MNSGTHTGWTAESWREKLQSHQVVYRDRDALERVSERLREMPPLVTSWEIERLKSHIADAQEGRRFLLQGGDCAETMAECRPDIITRKLKILLQMSLVLVHGSKMPVIRVGRFAGQYAKPRSSQTETRMVEGQELTLPSYFGDLVNEAAFESGVREPDPRRMLEGYMHAAMTLNFVRSLVVSGFADVHHPEYWDLGFMKRAGLLPEMRLEYERMSERLADGLKFMEAIGEQQIDKLARAEFFVSHEGLNLVYESVQTREVPRREGHYDLTTHLPWIGERTRNLDGAHVEFFRGIRNPVGIKIGPSIPPEELLRLIDTLNPENEAGKLVLITRMGRKKVADSLPPLLEVVQRSGKRVLWICDPMHGNTITTKDQIKTRSFDDVLAEIQSAWAAHDQVGTVLGGIHFELTGEDVTECIGGAAGISESDLTLNYASPCDPRLNYEQSLELAFLIARRMANGG